MSDFVLSAHAWADLRAIWEYAAAHHIGAADRLENELLLACERLAQWPLMGRKRDDLTDRDVYFFPVKRFFLIYDAHYPPVVILRILSQYRNIPKVLQ